MKPALLCLVEIVITSFPHPNAGFYRTSISSLTRALGTCGQAPITMPSAGDVTEQVCPESSCRSPLLCCSCIPNGHKGRRGAQDSRRVFSLSSTQGAAGRVPSQRICPMPLPQLLEILDILGLWTPLSKLSVRLPTTSPCVWIGVSPLTRTRVIGFRARRNPVGPHLNPLHLQRSSFQVSSHSKVSGGHEFGGHDTFSTGTKAEKRNK